MKKKLLLILYFGFVLVPIYWLVVMSLKHNTEITSGLTLIPNEVTFKNYINIFIDPSWYTGYFNAIYYVTINTFIS